MNQRLLNKLAKATPKKVELNIQKDVEDLIEKADTNYAYGEEYLMDVRDGLTMANDMEYRFAESSSLYGQVLDKIKATLEQVKELGIELPELERELPRIEKRLEESNYYYDQATEVKKLASKLDIN